MLLIKFILFIYNQLIYFVFFYLGETPLHKACRIGNSSIVKYLCHTSRAVRIDYRNKLKQTPLLLTHNHDIAITLISCGADVSCIDMNGYNAGL